MDEDSEMVAYYEALLETGRNLLMEDHRKIKWGDRSTAPDIKTLFRIWDERPNLDMTVGFMELSVPEEVMGKGKAGDYMVSVRASGSRNPFGTMEYKATVSLFRDCFRIGTFDYPFINDNLKSLTSDADVSENWARLFDYVRFAKPVDVAKKQQTGRVIA